MFNGRSILVTGGTGSFGKAFIKFLLTNYQPKRIIVYSRDELKQYEMQQELQGHKLQFVIGDVRDQKRLNMALHHTDFVVHAAALKQIPTAEQNPLECIKTNIMGSQNIINAAIENGIEKVISLSTDKAANPANLYGATKLAADRLFIAANNLVSGAKTRFSVVRYGNVLGSRGSVISLFRKLLAQGASELPITDPRMTRFWITLAHGVQFVVKSFERMQGGEIFIPKLPSASIMNIVQAMSPNIKTKTIGIRVGEKLHELLCTKDDARMTLEFSEYYMIKPGITYHFNTNYECNPLGEQGHLVQEDFEYSSETNTWFLTEEEIQELIYKNEAHQFLCQPA
ncbi:MAG: UDP-N-acetylglucosamine 4,6-dehydratase (inverting) [Proteobacteria bacterium]|nr:UDP-N-acetylglucosamine 4,6-dehydratase (inverting) [Pseudomonadota bacterium]